MIILNNIFIFYENNTQKSVGNIKSTTSNMKKIKYWKYLIT